jgi:hypothetical protein
MKSAIVGLFAIVLVGCASLDHKVAMTNLQQPSSHFLVDETKPDDYPSFAAGEGNIYSCRYGIHYQSADEFDPPKAEIFAALLAEQLPSIVNHNVELERFDVFLNQRLKYLHMVGRGMGGAVGEAIASVGTVNLNVYTFKKIQIDSSPGTVVHLEENMVGCDNAFEGEYYASEISGGHDVVVTWLKFRVDETTYHFKTYYQFQPADDVEATNGVAEAIRMSIEGIAPKIAVQ